MKSRIAALMFASVLSPLAFSKASHAQGSKPGGWADHFDREVVDAAVPLNLGAGSWIDCVPEQIVEPDPLEAKDDRARVDADTVCPPGSPTRCVE